MTALHLIDAFAEGPGTGNPAGVVLLEDAKPVAWMQAVAMEMNQAETAFLQPQGGDFALRWFTPFAEVDLCGHATLASAFIVFHELGFTGDRVSFQTKIGELGASRDADRIVLDFPAWPAKRHAEVPANLAEALGWLPRELYKTRDFLAVFSSEEEILSLRPEPTLLAKLDCLGVICTAPGTDSDFVSRFFAPGAGIIEDPVTGSAHSTLIPYWSARLGKKQLFARQLSQRGGELFCEDRGERVGIGGKARLYSRAQLEIA